VPESPSTLHSEVVALAPKLVLYGTRANPYTEKCRLALVLKGLEYELREPSGPEDFRRWSPETGLLPVMTVDDELVSDSTNILLRLDEIRPDPPLLSPDPKVAAQQRHLEDWADEAFLWYWLEWQRAAEDDPARSAGAGRLRTLRRLGGWRRVTEAPEPARAAVLRGLDDRLNDLLNLLGGRRFFYADRLSMADLTVYALLKALSRNEIPGTAERIAERPALLDFMRRVEEETGG